MAGTPIAEPTSFDAGRRPGTCAVSDDTAVPRRAVGRPGPPSSVATRPRAGLRTESPLREGSSGEPLSSGHPASDDVGSFWTVSRGHEIGPTDSELIYPGKVYQTYYRYAFVIDYHEPGQITRRSGESSVSHSLRTPFCSACRTTRRVPDECSAVLPEPTAQWVTQCRVLHRRVESTGRHRTAGLS